MPQESTNRPQAAVVYDCTLGQRSPDEVDGEQMLIDCVAETTTAANEPRIDVYI